MLRWALLFLVIALISGVLGFGNIAGMSYDAARIIFFIFLVLFVLTLFMGRGRSGNVV